MASGWFVTGTDTGVGKTLVSVGLLAACATAGLKAIGMKPVAAGCEYRGDRRVYEDVEALTAAANVSAAVDLVNPYRLEPPIAPHIAAAREGVCIDIERIVAAHRELHRVADVVVVEGAGGLLVPLNARQDMADLALALGLPLLLVVGMRLGCLNHALLTAEAIVRRGLTLAGWVANRLDADMAEFDANVATLGARIPAPMVGSIPSLGAQARDPHSVARHLDVTKLILSRSSRGTEPR